MKKLILLSILLIVGCITEPEPEDCAGVTGGTAVEDCAGVCGGDTTQETCDACQTSVFDCAGVCEGSAVEDACGVCNGNSSSCIIDLPTEFPLVANSGWVYEVSKYTNVEDFLSGNNSTITKDTLVILDTSQDYYLWHWGGSNIDSTSIGLMYKNHENKLLFLGLQEILSEDVIQLFDKPVVYADFSATFTIDTLNYDYGFKERTTTIDTLFENLYHTYVFPINTELLPQELSDIPPLEFHFTQEGWSFYHGFGMSYMDGIMHFTTSKMIEKLDYIEIIRTRL